MSTTDRRSRSTRSGTCTCTSCEALPTARPPPAVQFPEATAFVCFRCGSATKSKLITVYGGDWGKRLCNGCYGRLLSIYDVKAGAKPHEEAAELLAQALLELLNQQEHRDAETALAAKEALATSLSRSALRFVASAEHVAACLCSVEHLEWSPAVIGLCKALEVELVERMMRPLAGACDGLDLSADIADGAVARVARFCAAPVGHPPPELGATGHFLRMLDKPEVRARSRTANVFLALARSWTGSDWILSLEGLSNGLGRLTREFRNRAAHIDELSRRDYERCRDLVMGADGLLWGVVAATAVCK